MSDEPKKCTLLGKPPDLDYKGGAPQAIDPATGMHKDYWVLCPEERAKGFVRPLRRSYIHIGRPAPKYPLRDLTDTEKETYKNCGYVKFEAYPEDTAVLGKYWTQRELDSVGKGCQGLTSMAAALAETYARDPHFYGATFCAYCRTHLPVGEDGEFIWEDGSRVGT